MSTNIVQGSGIAALAARIRQIEARAMERLRSLLKGTTAPAMTMA